MLTVILCLAIGFVVGVGATAVFAKNNKKGLEKLRTVIVNEYNKIPTDVREKIDQVL